MICDYSHAVRDKMDHKSSTIFFLHGFAILSHTKSSQKNEIQKQIYPHFGLAPKHIYFMEIFRNMSTELMEKSYFNR